MGLKLYRVFEDLKGKKFLLDSETGFVATLWELKEPLFFTSTSVFLDTSQMHCMAARKKGGSLINIEIVSLNKKIRERRSKN